METTHSVKPLSPRDPSSAAMPSDLKVQNRMRILKCFRDGAEYTAGDVSALTGISKLTVMRAIQYFCAKNVLITTGKGSSTELGGKKPDRFCMSAGKYLLSITLWPGNLNFALYDMLCRRISYLEIPTALPDDIAAVFALIEAQVNAYLAENGVDKGELFGVGLSTAGTIDYKTKHLKYSSLNPNWGTDIPVCEYLSRIFGSDVAFFVENAGKMTGRAALLDASLQDRRVLVLFSTWGLSACLIENGHILGGKDSLIGEIGHMTLDCRDDVLCGCGSRGCFERLIDIRRLRREIAELPPPEGSPLSRLAPQEVTLRDIFHASNDEDPYARSIVAQLAKTFALAFRNISLVFNPDVVIFQGDYSHAGAYFDEVLKAEMRSFRYFPAEGAFETRYDTRSLFELDARGAAITLADLYFSDPALYE